MNNKRNFLLIGISEFFSKVLSWLTLALIPFFTSPETYGEIVLYYSLITFLIPIYLFGQDRLILKHNPEDEVVTSLVFSFTLWVMLSLLLCYLDYFLASIAAFLLTLNKLYLTYYRSNEKFKSYSINRFIYSIVRFIFVVSSVYYFYSLNNYIVAEAFAALIVTSGLFLLFLKSGFNFKFDYINRFKHGFPLALHGASVFGIALADRFILEIYTDLEVVGNYSFIYIFASGLVFLYSIISVIQEKKIYKSVDNNELLINIKTTLKLMFMIGLIGSIISFFIYSMLFKFNIITNYSFYFYELILLLIAYIIFPIYLVANYFLIQKQKNKLLIYSSLISFVINVILNFLLIPDYGLQGAVFSTLISNILLCVFIFIVSFNVYKSYQ